MNDPAIVNMSYQWGAFKPTKNPITKLVNVKARRDKLLCCGISLWRSMTEEEAQYHFNRVIPKQSEHTEIHIVYRPHYLGKCVEHTDAGGKLRVNVHP